MTNAEIAATNARGEAIDAEVADLPPEKVPPKAYVVEEDAAPEVSDDDAASQFNTTHGGAFDPNSSVDRAKMEIIKTALADPANKGKTKNQIALDIYRAAG